MKRQRRHPALFHRVFLSHLITVLFCFGGTLILIDYLFIDGAHLYLRRNPIIVIPALLAIIGVAGLLALWSSGAAAVALGRLHELLDERADADAFRRFREEAGVEEAEDIAQGIHDFLKRGPGADLRPLTMILDEHLNVHRGDEDTAARLGFSADDLQRQNLRSLLPFTDDKVSLLAHLRLITSENAGAADKASGIVTLHFHAAAERVMTADCRVFALAESGLFLIVGWEVRRGAGRSEEDRDC